MVGKNENFICFNCGEIKFLLFMRRLYVETANILKQYLWSLESELKDSKLNCSNIYLDV